MGQLDHTRFVRTDLNDPNTCLLRPSISHPAFQPSSLLSTSRKMGFLSFVMLTIIYQLSNSPSHQILLPDYTPSSNDHVLFGPACFPRFRKRKKKLWQGRHSRYRSTIRLVRLPKRRPRRPPKPQVPCAKPKDKTIP